MQFLLYFHTQNDILKICITFPFTSLTWLITKRFMNFLPSLIHFISIFISTHASLISFLLFTVSHLCLKLTERVLRNDDISMFERDIEISARMKSHKNGRYEKIIRRKIKRGDAKVGLQLRVQTSFV